jgi:hypothetical protein
MSPVLDRARFPVLISILFFAALPGLAQEGTWTDVFNGTDLTGLKKHGNGTVTVTGGVIDANGGNGYLYTDAEYTHYRARVEWKNIGGGNLGYLHHIDLNKHACGDWPSGPELQMMQGDVGSIWTTDCKFNTTGSGLNYNETGAALPGVGQYGCGRTHFVRKDNKEKAGDWNTWEVFVKGDSLEIKVNGSAVMKISKLTSGGNVAMTKGRMGLQIEGSHVQWRNWQVMDLTKTTAIAPKRGGAAALLVRRGDFRLQAAAGVVFDLGKASGAPFADASGRILPVGP